MEFGFKINMDKRKNGRHLLGALLMLLCLVTWMSAAAADTDPIRVSSLSEPQSVITEQDVDITIKIYNSSQTDMEQEITLFNPDRYSVEKFAGLKAEQSVTYTGKWHVTNEQIQKGRINYFIRYNINTESGLKETVRTIPVTIQTEAASPQLTATYTVSPTAAREGQNVNIAYTLSNTGNVELRGIEIANSGVTKETLKADALSVGEKITLEYTLTMGDKELISKPVITYTSAESSKKLTIDDMARKTITPAKDGLIAEITGELSGVYPGETAALTLNMKNTGEGTYTALQAALSDGTVIAENVELASGASFEKAFELPVSADTPVAVTVTGRGGNGEAVSVQVPEVTVRTADISRALLLRVYAQAQQEVIHTEPAVVRFGVVVENYGATDAINLSIRQGGTVVAKIPSLPAGESRTVVFDLETSIAGKFLFEVSGRDADEQERSFESNVVTLTYAAPTPVPTAAPTPTRVPPTPTPVPTATPVPSIGEIIRENVDPTVLYGTAATLSVLLIAILGMNAAASAKRKKRLENAIDTLERHCDVRDHRGKKHSGKRQKHEDEVESVPQEENADDQRERDSRDDEGKVQLPKEDTAEVQRRRRAPQEEVKERPQQTEQPETEKTIRMAPIGRAAMEREAVKVQGDTRTMKIQRETLEDENADEATLRKETIPEETVREDHYEGNGQRLKDLKPMKKKKGFFGFGRGKDDLLDDDYEEIIDDEDLIE